MLNDLELDQVLILILYSFWKEKNLKMPLQTQDYTWQRFHVAEPTKHITFSHSFRNVKRIYSSLSKHLTNNAPVIQCQDLCGGGEKSRSRLTGSSSILFASDHTFPHGDWKEKVVKTSSFNSFLLLLYNFGTSSSSLFDSSISCYCI